MVSKAILKLKEELETVNALYLGTGTGGPAFNIAQELHAKGGTDTVVGFEIHSSLVSTQRSKEAEGLRRNVIPLIPNIANLNLDFLAYPFSDEVNYFFCAS